MMAGTRDKPVRVLVVDDSALIRKVLREILDSDPGIEVIATAGDPLIAREKIRNLNPDVVTLDIEMPKLDGLSFLERIMRLRPMPVVMISSLTERGSDVAVQALRMGAVDALPKPKVDIRSGLIDGARELIRVVKAAARVNVKANPRAATAEPLAMGKLRVTPSSSHVIGIGASTGGVYALHEVISRLPADTPPVLIVQHMTGTMIPKFTMRLNENARMNVILAEDGARLMHGHVYVAPYNHHLTVARNGAQYVARLVDAPPVSGHRPAVDPLFSSLARVAGPAGVGVILTGMGRDGAAGMLEMRAAGAVTIGQDEQSSLIYGMPKAAMMLDAVEKQLPLDRIASQIIKTVSETPKTAMAV